MATLILSGRTHRWGVPMTIGILLIAGGVFAFFAAVLTTFVSILYLGALLLIVGVLELVSAFRIRDHGPFFAFLLAGLLAIVVGALFLMRPLAGIATVTLLVAGYLFASGLFRGVTALVDRFPHRGWNLGYAVVAIALGAYVVASWPLSALWVLGTIVAAEITVRGVTLVAAAWTLHELERSHA